MQWEGVVWFVVKNLQVRVIHLTLCRYMHTRAGYVDVGKQSKSADMAQDRVKGIALDDSGRHLSHCRRRRPVQLGPLLVRCLKQLTRQVGSLHQLAAAVVIIAPVTPDQLH